MRRTLIPVVTAAFALFATASTTNAQKKVVPFLGAGMIMPTGDLGTYADNGWMVFGGLDWNLASTPGLAIGVSAIFGNVGHNDEEGASTTIPGLSGDVAYILGATSPSKVKIYLRGGLGMLQHRYNPGEFGYESESETKAYFHGGAGLNFIQAARSFFLGAHMINAGDTSFLLLHGGLAFSGSGTR